MLHRIAITILVLLLLTVPVLADSAGTQWLEIGVQTPGTPVEGHATFQIGNNSYFAGGIFGTTYISSTFYTTDGIYFKQINCTPAFTPRAYMAYAVFDNKMWMMGGLNSTAKSMNDTWFSTDGDVWTLVNASSAWQPRAYSHAAVFNGALWLVGGMNTTSGYVYTDAWFLTTENESLGIWTNAHAIGLAPIYGGNLWVESWYAPDNYMYISGNSGGSGTIWQTPDGSNWVFGAVFTPAVDKYGASLLSTSSGPLLVGGYDIGTAAITRKVYTNWPPDTAGYYDSLTWSELNFTPNIPLRQYFGMVERTSPVNEPQTPWAGHEGLYMYDIEQRAGTMCSGSDFSPNTHVSLAPPHPSVYPASTSGSAPLLVNWTYTTQGYATTWVWDFRDGYGSLTQNASHTFTSLGLYPVIFTPSSPFGANDQMSWGTATVALNFTSNVTVNTPQSQIVYYTQKQVRLKTVDARGVPLIGATITANYVASTLPSTSVPWLVSAFGISQEVAAEMTNGGLAMTGVTGSDGSLTFMMFPSLTYGITVTNATLGLTNYVTIAPQDSDYTIYNTLSTQARQNSTYMALSNTTLFITEPTASTVTFNLIYYDPTGLTTDVKFNVSCWSNQTMMYYLDHPAPGTGVVTDSYTVPNVKGQEWRFWYNATRSAPL